MARMGRIQVRVEKNLRQKIRQWAAKEGLPPAEFYRRLFEWAADHYAKAGDLGTLRSMAVPIKKGKGKETK